MDRQIKFRVWNKKTNNWVDGCAPSKTASCDGVNLFGETILLGQFMCGVSLEDLNDCEALQFTGLEDKNGKEIFEGDIIKAVKPSTYDRDIREELTGQVWYADDKALFAACGYKLFVLTEIEVIGNIFENPELLK